VYTRHQGEQADACPYISAAPVPRVGITQEIPIALFVAQHRHPPDRCPASSGSGSLLLSRVSAAAAAHYGVTIEAEALMDGEHLLLLVVQAASQEAVERFLTFLPGPGYLQVLSACSAEEAVQRGGCGPASRPAPGRTDDPPPAAPPAQVMKGRDRQVAMARKDDR
jgi:hypothetical protein